MLILIRLRYGYSTGSGVWAWFTGHWLPGERIVWRRRGIMLRDPAQLIE